MDERADLWPDVKFTFNVTGKRPLYPRDTPFPWHYFMVKVPALQALHPIEAVWVVWLDGRGHLYFKSEAGTEVLVDLGGAGWSGVQVRGDVLRIDWNC